MRVSIAFRARRTFSQADRDLLVTLASRAGIAIQNARLLAETQRRARELEALQRADEALHRSLDTSDVLLEPTTNERAKVLPYNSLVPHVLALVFVIADREAAEA